MDADGGDQAADEMKKLSIKDEGEETGTLDVLEDEDESLGTTLEKKPTLSVKDMHFTNGDWYPEEKPRIAPPPDDSE